MKIESCSPRLPRKVVTTTRLTKILTSRIQSVPNADGALRRVFKLSRPDENGCNWIPEFASCSSSSALYLVVAQARLEFNLKED